MGNFFQKLTAPRVEAELDLIFALYVSLSKHDLSVVWEEVDTCKYKVLKLCQLPFEFPSLMDFPLSLFVSVWWDIQNLRIPLPKLKKMLIVGPHGDKSISRWFGGIPVSESSPTVIMMVHC